MHVSKPVAGLAIVAVAAAAVGALAALARETLALAGGPAVGRQAAVATVLLLVVAVLLAVALGVRRGWPSSTTYW